MIEKIEAKITEHINTILSKDVLTHEDYMTLTNELCRLKQKEHDQMIAANNEAEKKMWLETLNNMIGYKIH